jgi:hypothetical protein
MGFKRAVPFTLYFDYTVVKDDDDRHISGASFTLLASRPVDDI